MPSTYVGRPPASGQPAGAEALLACEGDAHAHAVPRGDASTVYNAGSVSGATRTCLPLALARCCGRRLLPPPRPPPPLRPTAPPSSLTALRPAAPPAGAARRGWPAAPRPSAPSRPRSAAAGPRGTAGGRGAEGPAARRRQRPATQKPRVGRGWAGGRGGGESLMGWGRRGSWYGEVGWGRGRDAVHFSTGGHAGEPPSGRTGRAGAWVV